LVFALNNDELYKYGITLQIHSNSISVLIDFVFLESNAEKLLPREYIALTVTPQHNPPNPGRPNVAGLHDTHSLVLLEVWNLSAPRNGM